MNELAIYGGPQTVISDPEDIFDYYHIHRVDHPKNKLSLLIFHLIFLLQTYLNLIEKTFYYQLNQIEQINPAKPNLI